jgi:salicylate hydroxylase
VSRGNQQQYLYHVHDGVDQQERDRQLRAFGEFNGKGKISREQYEAKGLKVEDDPLAWRWGGVGSWLLTYVCEDDVDRRWREVEMEVRGGNSRNSDGSVRSVL